MNNLVMEEIRKNGKDDEFISDIIDESLYLKSLNEKRIDEINDDKLNDIIEMMKNNVDVLYSLIDNNYYFKKWFFAFFDIKCIIYGKSFTDIYQEYVECIDNYTDIIDEIDLALENIKKRTASDAKLAHSLIYLTFFAMNNDMAYYDLNMFNKNKYKDTDIKNFSETEEEIKKYYLWLKCKNREYKK